MILIEILCVLFLLLAFIAAIVIIYNSILNAYYRIPIDKLAIPKSKFVNLVNDWCHDNISDKKTKKPVPIIKYHTNKLYVGRYFPSNHQMYILVNAHNNILELTDTIIHEYVHAKQNSKSFSRKYNQHLEEKGYWDNPYEVESRELAEKYRLDCIRYLVSNCNILK